MSFGVSVADITSLIQLCWATFEGAKKACGEHDDVTKEMSSLHTVLGHLHSEISDPDSVVHKAKGDRRQELEQHIEGCRRHLRRINSVLTKFNALTEKQSGVGHVWKRIQFGNGSVKDISKSRLKLSTYMTTISMTLQLLALGSQGRVEKELSRQRGDARGLRASVELLVAKLCLASREGTSEHSSYNVPSDDDKKFWRSVCRELVKQGYRSGIVRLHRPLIIAYVKELGDRGVLDDKVTNSQARIGGENNSEEISKVGDVAVAIELDSAILEPNQASVEGPAQSDGTQLDLSRNLTTELDSAIPELDQISLDAPAQNGEIQPDFSRSLTTAVESVLAVYSIDGPTQVSQALSEYLQTLTKAVDTNIPEAKLVEQSDIELEPSDITVSPMESESDSDSEQESHQESHQGLDPRHGCAIGAEDDFTRHNMSKDKSVLVSGYPEAEKKANRINDVSPQSCISDMHPGKLCPEPFDTAKKCQTITLQGPWGVTREVMPVAYHIVKTWAGMQSVIEGTYWESIAGYLWPGEYCLLTSEGWSVNRVSWSNYVQPGFAFKLEMLAIMPLEVVQPPVPDPLVYMVELPRHYGSAPPLLPLSPPPLLPHSPYPRRSRKEALPTRKYHRPATPPPSRSRRSRKETPPTERYQKPSIPPLRSTRSHKEPSPTRKYRTPTIPLPVKHGNSPKRRRASAAVKHIDGQADVAIPTSNRKGEPVYELEACSITKKESPKSTGVISDTSREGQPIYELACD